MRVFWCSVFLAFFSIWMEVCRRQTHTQYITTTTAYVNNLYKSAKHQAKTEWKIKEKHEIIPAHNNTTEIIKILYFLKFILQFVSFMLLLLPSSHFLCPLLLLFVSLVCISLCQLLYSLHFYPFISRAIYLERSLHSSCHLARLQRS